jgi:phospho-N-acetylmuramoyl-pentapeptide-transferase
MLKLYLLSALSAFALSLALCLIFIPLLRKMKTGQNILVYVKEHKNKGGTPTMGGLAFILAAIIISVLFIREVNRQVVLVIVIALSYMLVGLWDDFLKCRHKENLGLRAWQKFTFQGFIAVFAAIFCFRSGLTNLYIPFIHKTLNIGWWTIPLVIFAFLATVNAVNLTDGLDGLAAGSCVPYFLFLGIIIFLQKGMSSLVIVSFCLVGALLAYLLFNVPKASVFMGDTGSLALGGFAASLAAFSGNTLYIAVLGLPFVCSVVSVILQVAYFKCTKGKRIFLMSPIHHHFQQKGYSESKISYAYSLVVVLLGTICVITII